MNYTYLNTKNNLTALLALTSRVHDLLKNAPILVMDEAVSSLDAENERLLQQAVACARPERHGYLDGRRRQPH